MKPNERGGPKKKHLSCARVLLATGLGAMMHAVGACGGGASAAPPPNEMSDAAPLLFHDAGPAGPDASHASRLDGASDAGRGNVTDGRADGSPATEAGEASSSATYPAFHPAMPQTQNGGTVITAPKIVNVSFANDPLEGDIDTFSSVMASTTYWGDRTKEYGIAPLTVTARIHDPTVWPATTLDSSIQEWLIGQLAGDAGQSADAGWTAPDGDTVYALYFPPGVTVNMGGGLSCTDFHGYHSNVTLPNGKLIAYAVLSRCASIPEDTAATGIQYVSAVASHELIEAITDPFVSTAFDAGAPGAPLVGLGYAGTDPAHVAFEYFTSSELMDMCALIPNGTGHTAFYTPSDFPYVVQRGWSNAAARQYAGPCLPAPQGEVYFNSVPVLPDTFSIADVYGVVQETKGVSLPLGQTTTIEIDLWSDGPTTGPWTVSGFEDGTSSLSFSLDRTTGQNGDKLHLTITSVSANAMGGELVVLLSSMITDTDAGTVTSGTFFPFFVLN